MSDTSVLVATFQSPVEANIARTRLEEHDIACRLDDENMMTSYPLLGSAVGGVKLMVHEDNAQAAVEVLSQSGDESFTDFDWDAEFPEEEESSERLAASDLSCPECASKDIGFGTLFHVYWSLVLLFFIGPFFIPRTPATAWLVDNHLMVLPIGFFIGFWLAILRLFPLGCKECGAQGMRRRFRGNEAPEASMDGRVE